MNCKQEYQLTTKNSEFLTKEEQVDVKGIFCHFHLLKKRHETPLRMKIDSTSTSNGNHGGESDICMDAMVNRYQHQGETGSGPSRGQVGTELRLSP